MPRKSKWEDEPEPLLEEAPVWSICRRYDYKFVGFVMQTVREAACSAMELQTPQPLTEALQNIEFPSSANSTVRHAARAGFYMPNRALSDIAEALWYAYGPPLKATMHNPRDRQARPPTQVGRQRSSKPVELFCGRFIEAWARLEEQVIDKLSDARDGLVEEVVAQTISGTMPDDFPVSTERLMRLATVVEDSERLHRLEAAFNYERDKAADKLFRFGANYAYAYRTIKRAKPMAVELLASADGEERKGWEENVKRNFPELKEHPDLIKRLIGPQNLPEWLDIILAEKGGSSSIQDIALEYASRLCGRKPYSYTRRGLLKRLEAESRRRKQHQAPYERNGFGFVSPLHTLLLNWWHLGHQFPPELSSLIMEMEQELRRSTRQKRVKKRR